EDADVSLFKMAYCFTRLNNSHHTCISQNYFLLTAETAHVDWMSFQSVSHIRFPTPIDWFGEYFLAGEFRKRVDFPLQFSGKPCFAGLTLTEYPGFGLDHVCTPAQE